VLSLKAQSTLDYEIKQIKSEIEELLSDGKNGKRREGTLARKLECFDKMQSKVETFSSVLSLEAESLKADIEQARWRLKIALDGSSLPQEQPPQEPDFEPTEQEFGPELQSGVELPPGHTQEVVDFIKEKPEPETQTPPPAWDVDAGF
jgi:hypothetical protein